MTPLTEAIIAHLRDAVARGKYKPGEHIAEPALCSLFSTSRTPVREALRYLEKEGLIRIVPNSGARIVKLTAKDASHIYDMLTLFDAAACRLACSEIADKDIGRLEEYESLMAQAAGKRNLDLLTQLNEDFHLYITECTKNPYLISTRSDFRRLMNPIRRFSAEIPEQLVATIQEHSKITDALRKRNPSLAEFLARQHVEQAKGFFLDYAAKIGLFED